MSDLDKQASLALGGLVLELHCWRISFAVPLFNFPRCYTTTCLMFCDRLKFSLTLRKECAPCLPVKHSDIVHNPSSENYVQLWKYLYNARSCLDKQWQTVLGDFFSWKVRYIPYVVFIYTWLQIKTETSAAEGKTGLTLSITWHIHMVWTVTWVIMRKGMLD